MFPQKKIPVLPKQNALIKCRLVNVCIILLPDAQPAFQGLLFVPVVSFISIFSRPESESGGSGV